MEIKKYEDMSQEQRELYLTIANTEELYKRVQNLINAVMKKEVILFDVLFSSPTFRSLAIYCLSYYNNRYGNLGLKAQERNEAVALYLYDEITERMLHESIKCLH